MARNISVVVPFYEKKVAFKKTFNELRIQLNPGDEVIVADDHSPSGVGKKACGCRALKIVRPPKLETHIYRLNTLRNLGIKAAKHDAIVLIDPDCVPNKNFLESARRIFDPSILFAGRIDYRNKEGGILKLDPRRGGGSSRWIDRSMKGAGMVWGGVMLFSKSRVALVGMFDTDYDGAWGAEDHDFGERCYSSGMRLRYEPALQVTHQWHPKVKINYQRNQDLWTIKRSRYLEGLNVVTPYKPAVGVLIATLKRPYYIDQVMRAVFRTRVPLRVRLVNQGDHSAEQKEALAWWKGKWAVDVIENSKAERLSVLRTEAMKFFANKCKYMLLLDDDMLPHPGSIEALLRAMDVHPEYHAIAGGIIQKYKSRMLGGYIIADEKHQYYSLPFVKGIVETAFVSSGFTVFKLDPLVPYDTEYDFGWNDWDWSNELRKRGLRVAVCGDAIAYHRYVLTSKGPKVRHDSEGYLRMRQNQDRHRASAERFRGKWGYMPRGPKLWDRPVFKGVIRT